MVFSGPDASLRLQALPRRVPDPQLVRSNGSDVLRKIRRLLFFFDPATAHASCCPRAPRGDAPFSRSRGPFGTIPGVPDISGARCARCAHAQRHQGSSC